MTVWSPQHYRKIGQAKGVDPNILERAIEIGERIIANDHRIQPVFTLRHLSSLADVDYDMLRTGVSRSNADPYRIFRIRKRPAAGLSAGFRVICVPEPWLSKVQRWIVDHILAFAQPHNASVAYAKGSDIKDAALLHCGCRWLIKLDIRNFFESVSEIDVYSVFRELNFEPLISFEMARLCTR
ncbi:MAG: RNA-directed DNA polymerase, partial [Pseudomonadota bacterium]